MRGCRSSAALCVSIASMSIVRHDLPVVLFGGIFATVPLLGVVMRYTIPPLFFVNYVGIVSRHRLCRSTNSYVPWCLVRALSVSALLLSSIVPHGMRLVVRLLRYASASRLCQLSGIICRLFCSEASLPPFPFWGVVMRYTIPPLFFVNYVGIVSRHRLCRSTNSYVPWCPVCALSVSSFPFFRPLSRMVCGLSFVCCAMRQHRVYVNCPA